MPDAASITREWFSAAELEALALPGLPGTRRGIAMRAQSERWVMRQRSGRGGGMEFHRGSLPAEARRHLLRQDAAALIAEARTMERTDRERLRASAEELSALLLTIAEELARP